jgi:hypothetical protein
MADTDPVPTTRGSNMNRTHSRLLAAFAATACLFVLAGCGSGDGDDSEKDTTTTEAAAEATTTTAAEEPADDVTEPVTTNFVKFFDNFDGDLTLLENGEAFESDVAGMRESAAAAGSIGVDVHSVTPLEDADCEAAGTIAPCAEVNFDLVVAGDPAVPDQTGYAVLEDDTWKVSASTFCALTALGSGTPEACP